MPSLKNDLLHIQIKSKGAELSHITSVRHQKEFLWQADPTVWGSHAPNLFPIIGALKADSYRYNSQTYQMPKHGFVRHNDHLSITNQTDSSITFRLTSNSELFKLYPFLFQFEITYTLHENKLTVTHTVTNLDDKIMYFSLGGHPAFNCPLAEDEGYTDYYLEFETDETSPTYLLNMDNGLLTNKTKPIFADGNRINLRPDLFNEDALIFKELNSRMVRLKHRTKGEVLQVNFKDFNSLGIWAKPNAPYVCIEPWLGYADNETTDQKLETKEGILSLEADSKFNATYTIEIAQKHLI
ncbi:aldose 1-epimerase family protein [Winogradskyella sediminis]|uniref:Galactose mutarotase n=1 Tax=Winogradskyella sediminis TaxID=1382466 RepID=A0A1H1WW17_9FLAO|nr:aldose 1-epimerase family protein [Winogradskyella sediminis]SDT01347.1 Galactose mutarotase [Winogradskyella sediminis]